MATKGDTQKIPSILRRIFRSRTLFFKTIRTRTRLRTTIWFQFLTRTRTRTNFWKKIRTRPLLRTKNQIFSVPVYVYVSVHGYGNVEVDGIRLRTPDPGLAT